MTPRTSVRAAARERYGELRRRVVAEQATPSLTLPLSGGGDTSAPQDLTARIRALYEDTSVPVREIAAIAGVSERTLYKYVVKHGWKKRYAVMPRGLAAAAHNRGRRWASTEGRAPAKGAGGRFIRREDIGKPFASGLKALDAAGRAQALARCDDAEPSAREAQREAVREYWLDERSQALRAVTRALRDLTDYHTRYASYRAAKRRADQWVGESWRRPEVPSFVPDDSYEHLLRLTLAATTDWWQAAQQAVKDAS